MSKMIGKPYILKQVNLSLIRKVIRDMGSATRSEIVLATEISVTTVRTILTEMLQDNEIVAMGHDESTGGRKAVRYALNKDRFSGVALCLDKDKNQYFIVNICGGIQDKGTFEIADDITDSICTFLDELFLKIDIHSIGIGVPGIVSESGYQRMNEAGDLVEYPLGSVIRERYGVPVILENDQNAVTLGFGRCYLNKFPKERCDRVNMAYIHFGKTCISAGFLSEGRLLRGWNNFVGELGLFPMDHSQTLDELLTSDLTDKRYSEIIAKLIAGICCVLNPQYVAVGGEGFRRDCLSLINECFDCTLPEKMTAEILYAEDKWYDYMEGMAYLTAEQIFADVQLIKK